MDKHLIKHFISNLLNERDFLCWQLSEAYGSLDKAENALKHLRKDN